MTTPPGTASAGDCAEHVEQPLRDGPKNGQADHHRQDQHQEHGRLIPPGSGGQKPVAMVRGTGDRNRRS